MPSKAKSRTLTDHEEIQHWAEEREAKPSAVRRTHTDEGTGIIRLDFPGYSGEDTLEEISWDEWFEDFDRRKLALIVQDETAGGQRSNFNKLVSRETVEEKKSSRARKSAGRSSSGRIRRESSEAQSPSARNQSQRKTGQRSARTRKKAA